MGSAGGAGARGDLDRLAKGARGAAVARQISEFGKKMQKAGFAALSRPTWLRPLPPYGAY